MPTHRLLAAIALTALATAMACGDFGKKALYGGQHDPDSAGAIVRFSD